MASDEQLQELEVLESIYPDELTKISDTQFSIRLNLEPPIPLPEDDEDGHPIINLHITYTPTYPDTPPSLDLTLITPNNAYSQLSFPEDKETLLTSLQETITENLGMAMIFALATTVKEAAETMIADRVNAVEKERADKLRAEEEKEMEKFRGTLVTRERFLEWRARFREELEEEGRRGREKAEEEERGKKSVVKEKRMTGRELYEKGLVGTADEEEEEGVDEDVDIAKLKVQD